MRTRPPVTSKSKTISPRRPSSRPISSSTDGVSAIVRRLRGSTLASESTRPHMALAVSTAAVAAATAEPPTTAASIAPMIAFV